MSTELEHFRTFLDAQIESGQILSPEESLALWRDPELRSSVAAVRQALEDYKNGDRGQPLQEVVAELRERFQIPEDA